MNKRLEKPLSEYIVDDERSEHVGYIHAGWVKRFLNEVFLILKKGDIGMLDKLLEIEKIAGEEFIK
jgi:hypothetical protein